jgi:ABC-type glycerol-3-phosphate transport system substrate-binding protein
MNIGGSDIQELVNYVPGGMPENPPDNIEGNSHIMGLFADADGNLWIIERGSYYYFDLPDDFDEESEIYGMYKYYVHLGDTNLLRQIDSSGAEVFQVDLSSFTDNFEYFYINTVSIDSDGLFYIGFEQSIYVIDNAGVLRFSLDVQNWVEQLVRMSDGTVAYLGWSEDYSGRVLRKINTESQNWGETVSIPHNAYNVFPGGSEYDLIYTDYVYLYGVDSDTGESVVILNWINSDIGSDSMENLSILPDGRIMLTSYSWDYTSEFFRPRYELIILEKVPFDSIPPKTILTLACMGLDWNLRNTIVNFNKTNTEYRIHVNDYAIYSTADDYLAGLTRLSTEIISGDIPDILLTSNLPMHQYISRGLIEDLYPFIDADPEYNREALVQSALRATEIDGSLYQIFSSFYIFSLWGNPSVLGEGAGWNMDEFMDVIRANPQASSPIGYYLTRNSFLYQAVYLGMDTYVDWVAGKVNFDTDEFVKLLEFAYTIPDEVDYDWENYVSEDELIQNGQQIMRMGVVSNLMNQMAERVKFGGDLVYKGFPTENGVGNVLTIFGGMAMTTGCKDKDGAWQFMREILYESTSSGPGSRFFWGFPINMAMFNNMFEEAMTQEYYTDEDGNEQPIPKLGYYPSSGGFSFFDSSTFGSYISTVSSVSVSSVPRPDMGYGGFQEEEVVYVYAMTREEADQILELIETVSSISGRYDESLMTIITEGAESYFNGRATAQDAARVIQSRASVYIAEQS